MPHLQHDKGQGNQQKQAIASSMNELNLSSSTTEELPIQVASPNFLGTSDPVVAMIRKVSEAVVDSSFDTSPSSNRMIKNVISPSSSIGNINSSSSNSSADDNSTADIESTYPRKKIISTSAQSPTQAKRRISQIEEEETLLLREHQENPQHTIRELTFIKNVDDSPSTSESDEAKLKRPDPSLSLGKRSRDIDSPQEEILKTEPKKAKSKNEINSPVGDGSNVDEGAMGKSPTTKGGAENSIMAATRELKPSFTAKLPERDVTTRLRDSKPPSGQHAHHMVHSGFHPCHAVPPVFHPHQVSFGGHQYGPTALYHMGFPGYPLHVPPGTLSPMMVSQFHEHPASGFYAPYPPGFHPHQIHQHSPQSFPPFVPHYVPINGTALPATKLTNTEMKDSKNNQMEVLKSTDVHNNSTMDHSLNISTKSKTTGLGKPTSANRCVPLQEPIPQKYWGKTETSKNVVLPDFHRLVNYPDYLSKSRNQATGDSCSKGIEGKKNCVMCGKFRICSASSLMEKGRTAVSGSDGTAHIIPRQNKGLCTACDVTVWVLVADGLEIKWCKGCKNFRQWAAFGEKGSATKCVRCRERQREKYAMQKNAKKARRSNTKAVAASILSQGLSESSSQRISSPEVKDETHFAAARGLTSLMNAAAAL